MALEAFQGESFAIDGGPVLDKALMKIYSDMGHVMVKLNSDITVSENDGEECVARCAMCMVV